MSGGGRVLPAVAGMLARGSSRADRRRRRLLTAAAAMAALFLLAAVNVLLIRGTTSSRWAGLVTESGLRPGTALALALLVVPPLALLHQAGRVAQATRERRLAALRLAGATPRDVRLLGVVEAVRVGAAGAVAACVLYVPAQRAAMALLGVKDTERYAIPLWVLPAAVVLVAAAAAVVGLRVSRHVVASPLRVARRAPRPRPSRYALVPLAAGVLLMVAGTSAGSVDKVGLPLFYAGGIITVAGVMAGAGRLVLVSARLAGRRARSPETLLAARALEADPRAWGRTMAVVGLVVAFGTGTGTIEGDVIHTFREAGSPVDTFWLVSFGLTHLALLVALLVAVTALVVNRAEALLEGGHSMAVLAAGGAPLASLRRSARRQALIAATPVCVVSALAATAGMGPGVFVTEQPLTALAWTSGQALLTTVLAVAAAVAVTAVSGRLLARAASPARLRTA
ncbi:FtsX-like permease family protein [Spirillospora sp. NPDC029432]|uniref:FtsX-like permease family protein n=1 Tax=Spirillospora sp. NPDC029432 TaxID=3154599 RepID=UPI003456EF1F